MLEIPTQKREPTKQDATAGCVLYIVVASGGTVAISEACEVEPSFGGR